MKRLKPTTAWSAYIIKHEGAIRQRFFSTKKDATMAKEYIWDRVVKVEIREVRK